MAKFYLADVQPCDDKLVHLLTVHLHCPATNKVDGNPFSSEDDANNLVQCNMFQNISAHSAKLEQDSSYH